MFKVSNSGIAYFSKGLPLLLVVLLHILLVLMLLKDRSSSVPPHKETLLQFHILLPDSPNKVDLLPAIQFRLPVIKSPKFIAKDPAIVFMINEPADSHESDTVDQSDHATVFNPILRKRLTENVARSSGENQALKNWVDSSGTQWVEIKKGECIGSMPTTDSRSRGTNWSTTRIKCGKNESERMMDNINKDLQRRKHPKQ